MVSQKISRLFGLAEPLFSSRCFYLFAAGHHRFSGHGSLLETVTKALENMI
jgi:hypothetical protein